MQIISIFTCISLNKLTAAVKVARWWELCYERVSTGTACDKNRKCLTHKTISFYKAPVQPLWPTKATAVFFKGCGPWIETHWLIVLCSVVVFCNLLLWFVIYYCVLWFAFVFCDLLLCFGIYCWILRFAVMICTSWLLWDKRQTLVCLASNKISALWKSFFKKKLFSNFTFCFLNVVYFINF